MKRALTRLAWILIILSRVSHVIVMQSRLTPRMGSPTNGKLEKKQAGPGRLTKHKMTQFSTSGRDGSESRLSNGFRKNHIARETALQSFCAPRCANTRIIVVWLFVENAGSFIASRFVRFRTSSISWAPLLRRAAFVTWRTRRITWTPVFRSQTLNGPFSAVSKPNLAIKYSMGNSLGENDKSTITTFFPTFSLFTRS